MQSGAAEGPPVGAVFREEGGMCRSTFVSPKAGVLSLPDRGRINDIEWPREERARVISKQAVPRPPLIKGGNSQPNMRMFMIDNLPWPLAWQPETAKDETIAVNGR